MTVMNYERHKWLVVGGGLLGASTATRLREIFPLASVDWVLGSQTEFASADLNKIVRTTYVDHRYKDLAEHAMERWKSDPAYEQYFHPTGWIRAVSERHRKNTERTSDDVAISVNDLQNRLGTKTLARLEVGEELWENKRFGSVDAANTLQMLVQKAIDLGITTHAEDVQRMLVDDGSVCTGVELTDGRTLLADSTILSAGAWSPGLLERSKISYPHDFLRVVGVVVALLKLTPEEVERLQAMPILVTEIGSCTHFVGRFVG
jgi:glycine/D-amino acid oxidase-like deaminating enzyme